MKLINSILQDSHDEAERFLRVADINELGAQNAIRNLVYNLKNAGIWDLLNVIYPLVGTRIQQHSVNLKDPYKFRMFLNGNIGASMNGLKGNGGYGVIPLNAATYLTSGDTSLSISSRTNLQENTPELGSSAAGGGQRILIQLKFNGNVLSSDQYDTGGGRVNYSNPNSIGFFIGHRKGNLHRVLQNGVLLNQKTNSTGNTVLPSLDFQLFRCQISNVNSLKEISYVAIGKSFTEQQEIDYSNIIEQYQIALGRNL